MKKSLKIAALSAIALTFAGCASSNRPCNTCDADIAQLKAAVEENRAIALQARELSAQNAEKINRVWRKSQLK